MTDETTPPDETTDETTSSELVATSSDVGVQPLVTGTGTPPTSPNFGVPRYSSNDAADFPTQGNAITDTFDAQAAKRGAIVDADIAAGAAISKSKLAALAIVDADIAAAAAIAEAKLALATDAAPAVGSRRTLGRGATQAAPGNDTRLPTSAASAVTVLDVGLSGQVRAGRQLAVADFAALGLSAPLGLWNLSDLTDASGNARTLTNKGAVPFGLGINGAAATAAVFAGSTAQALYISDTGAADPFRIRTGSIGCWFRTAKRGVVQEVMSKWAASPQFGWLLGVGGQNVVALDLSTVGTDDKSVPGVSDVCDDRWHHAVITLDGATIRLYVDGVLESSALVGPLFGSSGPFNIGANSADGATAASNPHYGRVDEAFVTVDVLSDDQVRALYCAKLAHGLAVTPTVVQLAVRRRRKGGTLAAGDFPTQPLRLHNFTAGSLADEGSGGVALVSNPGTGSIVVVVGADGALGNAYSFAGAHTGLSASDTGLSAGTAARSYGCWFKTGSTLNQGLVSWGNGASSLAGAWLGFITGTLYASSGADSIVGPYAADGQWHHAVAVEDNAAGDGVKRKLYLDGRVVGNSTVLNAITLGGANRLRVGASADAGNPVVGQIDGAFVCGYALTTDQVLALYAKGSQALGPSPKNAGDHVESMDATNVYAAFDTLDSQHQIDLAVTG